MKKFEHLNPKELHLWEEHLQKQLNTTSMLPEKLLKSFWVDMYHTSGHIYNKKFNTRPEKTVKILEDVTKHRTYVENYTKFYDECG